MNENVEKKVYIGADSYLENLNYVDSEAVRKIIDICMKNDKIYILAIGALTNIASAINIEPQIIDKIKVIWLGGHSLLQLDNLEFNFKQDINSVRTVFNSKVELTVIPCKNVASDLKTSIYELNNYLKNKNSLCDYLLERFSNDSYK